jgi:hypothetical protein
MTITMNQIIFLGCGLALGFFICMYINIFIKNDVAAEVIHSASAPNATNIVQYPKQYHHENEGEVLAKLENIADEDYASSEGNEAMLFLLKTGCKIRLSVFGESGMLQASYYFKNNTVQYGMQSHYDYSAGGLAHANDATKPLKQILYANEIFNPQSERVQHEFLNLLYQFPEAEQQQCLST